MTSDPEVKVTNNGTPVCSFGIACTRDFAAKGEEKTTDFINVVAWRQNADFIGKYFMKGNMILVSGSLETRKYEDKNGVQRTAYEVRVDKAWFCGGANEVKVDPKETPQIEVENYLPF